MRFLHALLPIQAALPILISSSAAPVSGQAVVERQESGPLLEKDSGYAVSPRGQRLACAVGTEDGRGAVIVDGVRGPAFDVLIDPDFVEASANLHEELYWAAPRTARREKAHARQGPVVFSDDGTRCAYAVQRGEEIVVVVDGQELWRTPASEGGVSGLEFSPDSRHAFHTRHPRQGDPKDGFQLVLDGAAQRPSYVQPLPVFSPDGTRYAYVAVDLDRTTRHLIVDGAEADYLGIKPQWTAGNQLVTLTPPDPETYLVTVQLDGEKMLEAQVVERVVPDPVGTRVATITRGNGAHQLYIDAEQVSSGPMVEDVFWSADGARYGAVCSTGKGTRFLLLDGQAGPEYGTITGVTFSPDGSRVHFVAYTNGKWTLVLDNERQSPPALMPIEPRVMGDGQLAYVLGENLHKMTLVLGGEQLGPMREIQDLTLSDSGARYALAFGPVNNLSVLVDGMIFDDVEPAPFGPVGLETPERERFVFSPDAKHLVYLGWFKADPKAMGVFVDDAFIPTRSTLVSRPQFTPDSAHLIWIERAKPHYDVVVDGQLAAQFDLTRSSWWERHPDVVAMDPDGVFTIMGPIGGSIVKLRITPDPTTSVDTMIAAARRG